MFIGWLKKQLNIMLNTNRLLTSIANAFRKIESQDIRVGKILLPPTAVHTLLQDPYVLIKNILDYKLPLKSNDHFASLWGVKVYLANTFEVIGDNGFEHIKSPIRYYQTFNSLNIIIKSRADFTYNYSQEEWKALHLLREMISENDFRKYLKYGFILVKGASGDTYQIFRTRHHVKVWNKGVCIKEVCIYLTDKYIPKTDKIIAFKTIIETDEGSFLKMGNVYNMQKTAA